MSFTLAEPITGPCFQVTIIPKPTNLCILSESETNSREVQQRSDSLRAPSRVVSYFRLRLDIHCRASGHIWLCLCISWQLLQNMLRMFCLVMYCCKICYAHFSPTVNFSTILSILQLLFVHSSVG